MASAALNDWSKLLGDLSSTASTQRSRRTIQDFVETYFPYLQLNIQDFWRFMDVLVYVEATIYQMDEENEVLAESGRAASDHTLQGESYLLEVLRCKQLLDARLTEQLEQGKQYWRMERKLCAEMKHAAEQGRLADLNIDEVLSTSAAKSFDYRVLHLLILQLAGRPYNEKLFEFLQVDERLVDIGDDLVDYEDDVEKNSFNVLRAYVHMYGRNGQMKLVETISGLEAQHKHLLQQLEDSQQQHHHTRHCQASAVAGSNKWVFPKLILDEAAYRVDMASSSD